MSLRSPFRTFLPRLAPAVAAAGILLAAGCPPRPRHEPPPDDRQGPTDRHPAPVLREAGPPWQTTSAADAGTTAPVDAGTAEPADAGRPIEITYVGRSIDAGVASPTPERTADATTPTTDNAMPSADATTPTTTAEAPAFVERLGLQFARIPAGSFRMGSPAEEPGRNPNEEPLQVTLTRAFEISRTEVTQGQFERWMGFNPSADPECGADCPVNDVSWYTAAAFANRLSEAEGRAACYACEGTGDEATCTRVTRWRPPHTCPGYRLPTEAEWEYAARAGSDTAFPNGPITDATRLEETGDCARDPGADAIAWYCADSGGAAHPVCTKSPNAWGLCDMAGNVAEWTGDDDGAWPTGSATDPVAGLAFNRALRGGHWGGDARRCRSAHRDFAAPYLASSWNGFRVVRTLLPD